MVKNTVGGKKGKMMANKNGNGNGNGGGCREKIRMIEFPDIEVIVCVTKVFGGGLFEVVDNSGGKYRAFLRGKMKGHNKRHNLVALFSVLLVAKRIDTDPTKCDILFVYDSHDIQFLALNPMLNISNILYLHNNHSSNNDDHFHNANDDLFISNFNTTNNSNSNFNTSKFDNSKFEEGEAEGEDIDFGLI
jgi:translation initiation factor IF-1